MRRALFLFATVIAACSNAPVATTTSRATDTTSASTTRATTAARTSTTTTSAEPRGPVALDVTDVTTGLDTVWSLAWDPSGALWFTERPGRITRLGEPARAVEGVAEAGEGGLMGLEIDKSGRMFLMYTSADDNRIVRLEADGTQTVLVSGIARSGNHNGGRLRFGADGKLYAGTGDAQDSGLAQDDGSLNGKLLRIDPDTGAVDVFAKGLRNSQGLCLSPDGRMFSTEHGPTEGDEINVLTGGFNGQWPRVTGNGIYNWTPTIAPAGCAIYTAELIPQWKSSMLFVTLKEADLRRLVFGPDGSVVTEEILYDEEFGRLRDVAVGPDGAVYLATSNRDGRGDPRPGDDRILRIAPR